MIDKIDSTLKPKIAHIAKNLVLFELRPGEYAWASRHIANRVLQCGFHEMFLVYESPLKLPPTCSQETCNAYIAVLSTR